MFQLYKHLEISESELSSGGPGSAVEIPPKALPPAKGSPQTLEQLLAGFVIREKEARKPQLNRSLRNSIPAIPVDLDVSDGETSVSDSGSDSPVCVDLPPQPFIYQHTVSNVDAEISWTGPRSGELVSFYELQLQEARLTGQGKNIQWFSSQSEEHLENLAPGTEYIIRVRGLNVAGAGPWSLPYKVDMRMCGWFATMPAVPGMPLDPAPVVITVRRHRKPQKKTVFLPAS
ncbi:hypothetical protein lerEdw1_009573 [Lerista edwardsae]|nr:hypothetical protein lerEdw1_009573 [Lerista edwardsae]